MWPGLNPGLCDLLPLNSCPLYHCFSKYGFPPFFSPQDGLGLPPPYLILKKSNFTFFFISASTPRAGQDKGLCPELTINKRQSQGLLPPSPGLELHLSQQLVALGPKLHSTQLCVNRRSESKTFFLHPVTPLMEISTISK